RRRDLEASIVGRRRLDSALPVRRANAGRGFKSENALGCDDPIKAARKGRPGFLEFKLTFASFAADTDRQPGVEVNRSFDQISPTCSAAELQPHMAVFLAFARGESDLGISRFVQSRDDGLRLTQQGRGGIGINLVLLRQLTKFLLEQLQVTRAEVEVASVKRSPGHAQLAEQGVRAPEVRGLHVPDQSVERGQESV